jgi:hypothetical protein
MRTAVAPALLMSLICACQSAAADDAHKAQEDDIREAVFRRQVSDRKATVYFLAFTDEDKETAIDPPAEFLKRLADIKASIQKRSAAKFNANETISDPASGNLGVVLLIEALTRTSDDEVDVRAAVFGGGDDAIGGFYILKREKDGWKVVKSGRTWVH